ncbi:MAG: hypothetical protein GY936_20570 [Ignavibacteriae bacterium]|nr:hypothetical protein [Ignavibacteriota bacterium]
MKMLKYFFAVVFLVFSNLFFSQDLFSFNNYFKDATMRVDYFHIGDAEIELITIDHFYKQDIWAGSRVNLIDNFNNGAYYYKIYDKTTGNLIFSKGFDSYLKNIKQVQKL